MGPRVSARDSVRLYDSPRPNTIAYKLIPEVKKRFLYDRIIIKQHCHCLTLAWDFARHCGSRVCYSEYDHFHFQERTVRTTISIFRKELDLKRSRLVKIRHCYILIPLEISGVVKVWILYANFVGRNR